MLSRYTRTSSLSPLTSTSLAPTHLNTSTFSPSFWLGLGEIRHDSGGGAGTAVSTPWGESRTAVMIPIWVLPSLELSSELQTHRANFPWSITSKMSYRHLGFTRCLALSLSIPTKMDSCPRAPVSGTVPQARHQSIFDFYLSFTPHNHLLPP